VIPVRNDRVITISVGTSRRATQWPAATLRWSDLCERLRTPTRTTETLDQYLALTRAQQDALKDVGGFVGGEIRDGGRRKAGAVMGRDVLALDLDTIPAGGTDDVLRAVEALGAGACVYSTRKHHPAAPRLRVLLPTDRTITPDEYEPILRQIAKLLDPSMRMCDPSTFEVTRLMYWPSCSSDSAYVFRAFDLPFVSASGVLGMYQDWRDTSAWPQCPGVAAQVTRERAKAGDPTQKRGIVGAFCREYDVYRAMSELLPGVYEDTAMPDRYTYAGGSTTGGAVVYDNGQFLYSHHATDPTSGRLVNSFDLVRLHLYGDEDDAADVNTPVNRLPSYTHMCSYARSIKTVLANLQAESLAQARQVFATPVDGGVNDTTDGDNVRDVLAMLDVGENGKAKKLLNNVLLILRHDNALRGKFGIDEFASRGMVLGRLPWKQTDERRMWSDADDAGLRWYLEATYGLSAKDKVLDGVILIAQENSYNGPREYLSALTWDDTPRLDTVFTDYLGAIDNIYTRQVARKSFVAAVARIFQPSAKYDYMPILYGAQGIGKSTFLRTIGKAWFSDSLRDFSGKDARELLQGSWIIEIAELDAFNRTEMSAIKNFLSQQEDIYREPYGKHPNLYPRRCVFFGTTNDPEYLRDGSGERRFWHVDVGLIAPCRSVFTDLPDDLDQIWAEAVVRFQEGEYIGGLTGDALEQHADTVAAHKLVNAKAGLVQEFLDKPVPKDWARRDIASRRQYWGAGFPTNEEAAEQRERVCAMEIWCECFKQDEARMRRTDSLEINSIMDGIPGWIKKETTCRYGPYGMQRGYERAEKA